MKSVRVALDKVRILTEWPAEEGPVGEAVKCKGFCFQTHLRILLKNNLFKTQNANIGMNTISTWTNGTSQSTFIKLIFL